MSTWKIRIQLSLFYLCSGGNILLSYLLDSIPHSADALCFCGKNKLPKSENCTDSGSTSFGFRLVFWYQEYLKNVIHSYTSTWDISYTWAHTIHILMVCLYESLLSSFRVLLFSQFSSQPLFVWFIFQAVSSGISWS